MQFKLASCAVTAVTLLLANGAGHMSAPREFPTRPEAARVHIIPIGKGRTYISQFKATRDALYSQRPELKGQLDLPSSESFSRDAIAALLEQKDSHGNPIAGIRIYFGQDAEGQIRLILVSYDSRGNNIIQQLSSSNTSLAGDGEVIEDGLRCPPSCGDEENSLGGSQEASAPDAPRSHIIPMKDAVAYTARFRRTWNQLPRQFPELSTRLNIPRTESFNRDAIAVLLNQRDADGNLAAGIRIHFGLDSEGQVHLVLTPSDSRGKDIIARLSPAEAAGSSSTRIESLGDGEVIEEGLRCPPVCPPSQESILDRD